MRAASRRRNPVFASVITVCWTASIIASFGCEDEDLVGVEDAAALREETGGIAVDSGAGGRRDADPEDARPGLADAGAPEAGPDAGALDAGAPGDGSTPDTGAPDAGSVDAGGAGDTGGSSPDAGSPVCNSDMGDPDKQRVILIGHPFGVMTGQDGTTIRSLTLPLSGPPLDNGTRLDVGTRPKRIAFVPSGGYALVLGEDGQLVSVRVSSVTSLAVVDRVTLPSADYGDIAMRRSGRTAYIAGVNVGATSGISTVEIGCDGRLTHVTGAFFNLRLAESMVLSPGEEKAYVLGGQAVFDPVDPNDIRTLMLNAGGGFTELYPHDIYHDFVNTGRIALSPDGRTLLVPNGSPFSNEGAQVAVIDVDAAGHLTERRRLMNFPDASEALFSPDGRTALVTLVEPGRVVVLADRGNGFEMVSEVRGIGLADQMALVARGMLSGRVLLSSVDPSSGSNLASIQITGPGTVNDLGQIPLGMGGPDIPDAIAVQP